MQWWKLSTQSMMATQFIPLDNINVLYFNSQVQMKMQLQISGGYGR
jgi:hypothetical protein